MRPLRPQIPGGVYHVTARGNRRQAIAIDVHDYDRLVSLLAETARRYGWRIYAYCVMPNHFHLVVETPQANISAGMQWLNGRYGQRFNLRYGYTGHLFQGRFYSGLVESEKHLLELARYVVLNPVRARLCDSPLDWKWSSFAAMLARARRPQFLSTGWLLAQFSGDRRRARELFEAFVGDTPSRARPP